MAEKTKNMDQDCWQGRTHDRVTIDVGWYPDGDPDGRYVVRHVLNMDWGEAKCPDFESKDPEEVADYVASVFRKSVLLSLYEEAPAE